VEVGRSAVLGAVEVDEMEPVAASTAATFKLDPKGLLVAAVK